MLADAASAARFGISSAASIRRQAFATAAARRTARAASFGRQRLHGRNPALSASSQLAWKRTFSRRASRAAHEGDRKSTRLNSSHLVISYAVFCLKKKTTSD